MLTMMSSPVFKINKTERESINFKEGLNVILGKNDGKMSIGKSSALLVIDFVFGGDIYSKSDDVKQEGHHTIFFEFTFDGKSYRFARNTGSADTIHICDKNNNLTGNSYTKKEFTDWLKQMYEIDFVGLSFRTTLSSFFRIYGKENTDERRPLRGVPGESIEKSIQMLLSLYDKYRDIEEFKRSVTEHNEKLKVFRQARKYDFISNLVGGQTKYDENQARIKSLESDLNSLTEEAVAGHSEEDIEKSKLKTELYSAKYNVESQISAKERRLNLLDMSLEYGLYPTEADMSALQEFFPNVNLRKLYEVERYHQKLAKILDNQFSDEKQSVLSELEVLKMQLADIKKQIEDLGFVGTMSREFLNRHSEIKVEIDGLRRQNEAYLTQKELQEAKVRVEEVLRRGIEDILDEIEHTLNSKMKEFNDSLFGTPRKPPHIRFNGYNSYVFETPDDTGTGSNYKGMIVYDLAVLFTTALPALAHDSLLFKNLEKDVEDGIVRIYTSTSKQIFIAYDKQDDCRPETKRLLESNTVLKLSDNGHELYGRAWNKEEQ